MVQFKNVFTGLEKRPYSRAATAQKCVRAGGKHNDLDNVGYTARHHTFFEMLGNFSFGDYFKERAIELAWNLITKEFGLPIDRLIVTVYLDDDRGLRPLEEDRGPPRQQDHPHRRLRQFLADGRHSARADRARKSSTITATTFRAARPARRTPTATASSRSGISSSCSTSSWPAASASICRSPRSTPAWGSSASPRSCRAPTTTTRSTCSALIIAHVADLTDVASDGPQRRLPPRHRRPSARLAFLIADGVLPSNEGRGYVLRRIMRRAMRHAQLLGAREPLMWRLVPALVREMGQAYPELHARRGADHARRSSSRRRASARRLERGLAILDEETRGLRSGDRLKGETAFTLYDTYGFPLDLTQDALRPRGIAVDTDAFNAAMERQRDEGARVLDRLRRSRDRDRLVRTARESRRHRIPRLRDRERRRRGRGAGQGRQGSDDARQGRERRGHRQPDAVLRRIRRPGRRHRASCRRDGVRFRVTDTQKKAGDLFVHSGKVEEGTLKAGAALSLDVDHDAPQRDPAQPFRHPSAARGAAPGARRSRRAEGLAGRAGPAALRLLASEADDGAGDRAGRGHRQRLSCCRTRR